VSEPWDAFCVAAFTMDYQVTDDFQKPLFTARAGEQYLITSYTLDFAATLAYLTPSAPLTFGVRVGVDMKLPFTSNCAPLGSRPYFAVFADVSVFAEPQLTTKICDLAAGAAVPRDPAKNAGYEVEISGAGAPSAVYKVFLNAFSSQCGGMDNGYVRVWPFTALGSRRLLAPFELIPAE